MKFIYCCIVVTVTSIVVSGCSGISNKEDLPISEKVMNEYPAHVLSRVYDIGRFVRLSEEKQRKLSGYFLMQDSLASNARQTRLSADVIWSYYQVNDSFLISLLSPLELNDYILARNKYHSDQVKYLSELRDVVTCKPFLALSDEQVDSLLTKARWIELSSSNSEFDAKNVEDQAMVAYLSKSQISEYFNLTSKESAHLSTIDFLRKMDDLGVPHAADSSKLYENIYHYELESQTLLAKEALMGGDYYRTRDSLNYLRPLDFLRLEAYNNTRGWSRVGNAVYNRDSLQLKESQIVALLQSFRELQRLAFEARYQHVPPVHFEWHIYENEILFRELTERQFDRYLEIRYHNSALDKTRRNWEKLIYYKLVDGSDSSMTCQSLYAYELSHSIVREKMSIDKSKKYKMVERDIIDTRPDLLNLLDESVEKERENEIVRF